ncbi:MAG: hypothetical protein AAF311_15615, partial [Pseudomonadota bacterium]
AEIGGSTTLSSKAFDRFAIADKRRWYCMMIGWYVNRGKNPNAAYHAFKEKFGHHPQGYPKRHAEPDAEVARYMKSRLIAFAKRREKEKIAKTNAAHVAQTLEAANA